MKRSLQILGVVVWACWLGACSLVVSPTNYDSSSTNPPADANDLPEADGDVDLPAADTGVDVPADGSLDLPVDINSADMSTDAEADSANAVILWSADHEQGTIDQWSPGGGFTQTHGSYEVIDTEARGTYSVALSIDTTLPGGWAARLKRSADLPTEGYYSVWFFVPAGTKPAVWSDIFGWNSTGTSNHVMFYVGLDPAASGDLQLVLRHRPTTTSAVLYEQEASSLIPVPYDKWFHVEAFYKQGTGADGHVIVWQDGAKIFDVAGKPTVMAGEALSWSVCLFTGEAMSPPKPTILIDDAAIAVGGRIGP